MLAKTHGQFLDFVKGKSPRPLTSLSDARGYVIATNGMLLSSGDISTIDSKYLCKFQQAGDEGVDVIGLKEAVQQAANTGNLFSELKLPWSKPSCTVEVTTLKSLDFDRYC
jgi:hypothetical protein